MKKILVTGGTGFIGSAIVRALINTGNKVRILDNESRGAVRRLEDIKGRFEMILGDIRDPKIVEKSCENVDLVIHLAYINGTEFFYTRPELVLEVGVKGMVNVLDACIKKNIRELMLASSSEVYQTPLKIPTPENVPLIVPDPLNPRYSYGGGKIISELLVLNYGRKYFNRVLVLRPHNVYGPDMGREHVIPQLIAKIGRLSKQNSVNLSIQGTGQETRAFIYIDDFIQGFECILKRGKHMQIYNIGNMEETSIKKLINVMGRILGKKINIISGKLLEGSTPRRCPDITKIKRLGYKPKVSIEEGLHKTIQWYNQ